PLWQSSRFRALAALQSAGRGNSDARQRRLGWGMVAAELAMASILLAGAGLMIETLRNLSQVGLGYRPDGVLAASSAFQGSNTAARSSSRSWASACWRR